MTEPVIVTAIIVRTGTPRYLADAAFTTQPGDTPASVTFLGRIINDIEFDESIDTVFWSGGQTRTTIGAIDLANGDGALDSWLAETLRDVVVDIYMGTLGALFTTFSQVASGLIDALSAPDEDTLRLVLTDKRALLDRPLQQVRWSGGVGNQQLRGQPVPVGFGLAYSCLLPMPEPTTLDYACHDAEFGGVDLVRDRGVTLTKGAGWTYNPNYPYGIRKLASVDGALVADVRGAVTLGTAIISASNGGAFTSWTGGTPDGWTKTAGGGANDVTESPSDQARFQSNGGAVYLEHSVVLTAGQRYWITLTVTARASGRLLIQTGPGVITQASCPTTGSYRFGFVAAGGSLTLRLTADLGGDASCDITIDDVAVTPATLVERLPAVISYLCDSHGPLSSTDLDTTSINALDSATTYTSGGWWDRPIPISTIMDWLLDGYGGWWGFNRLGKLAVGRLVDPDTLSSVLTLSALQIDEEDAFEVIPDEAPGLSDMLACERNWWRHSDTDFAGSVSASTRETLKAEYRSRLVSATALAAEYAHAIAAAGAVRWEQDPVGIGTLLTNATQGQAEATRWGGVFSVRRAFYRFTAHVTPAQAATLEKGSCVTVQYARYGLSAGKKMILVGKRGRYSDGTVSLTCWR